MVMSNGTFVEQERERERRKARSNSVLPLLQIPQGGAAAELAAELKATAVFLSLGAIALQVYPPAATLVYLGFVVHLAVQFYEVVSTDTTDGLLSLIASVNAFCCVVGLSFFFLLHFVF